MTPFRDRLEAGRRLTRKLQKYERRSDVVVLALPRGGVPVAAEVAKGLGAPLDVFLVRKLGVPGHEELAMGAVAEGGVQVLNRSLIRDLSVSETQIQQVAAREQAELERRGREYRGDRHPPEVSGRVVILIDDGLATGATMEAAVVALRQHAPSAIVVAAPVGASDTVQRLSTLADEVVVAEMPEPFYAVGAWYADFAQTTDAEVTASLRAANAGRGNGTVTSHSPLETIRRRAIRLNDAPRDYDRLLELIGDARLVLIGEATHGTHEFYRQRALITQRLIAERGFSAVAAEADWPDAYRINRHVRHAGTDRHASDALADFRRFPTWMWRNDDVVDFVSWLREHNAPLPESRRAGFYGLDLYSLHASMSAVLRYLDQADPAAAARARRHYSCFDRYGNDPQDYAYTTSFGMSDSCERQVLVELVELRRRAAEYARRDGRLAADEYFFAEQNARLVTNAERYYRTMMGSRIESWNLRDRHMAETLDELLTFLSRDGDARVVAWAHNSHLGDARASEMGRQGELNLGQLVRERSGASAVLIGFTTHTGTVMAADDWDGPGLVKRVNPSLSGSVERLFHDAGLDRFLLALRDDPELSAALAPDLLERAIGVIYRPRTERQSHYFRASVSRQFDVVIHWDDTRAVEPVEREALRDHTDVAETFPSGV